jgi:hypothetical protein
MIKLQLTDGEARILLNLIDNYMPELEVEIHRTEGHDFREALEKKEKFLRDMIRRLGGQLKTA